MFLGNNIGIPSRFCNSQQFIDGFDAATIISDGECVNLMVNSESDQSRLRAAGSCISSDSTVVLLVKLCLNALTKLAGLTDMTVCCICESSVSAREHTNARPGKWVPWRA